MMAHPTFFALNFTTPAAPGLPSPIYFGSASVPADDGSNATTQVTITPPASMVVGDLVVVSMLSKLSSFFAVGITGGQVWRQFASFNNGGSVTFAALVWCIFNGTWSVNPRFDFSDGTCTSVVMHVFRPDSLTKLWALDQAWAYSTFAAPTTPFTVSRAGLTTVRPNTVSLAAWHSNDDNTWGTLVGTGWVVTGGAQYRNLAGQDISSTFAHHLNAAAAAVVPTASKNQATLGGDAGVTLLACWYAYAQDSNLKAYVGASSTDNNTVTTAAIDTTGATLIVIHVGNQTGMLATVTDSKGNTWAALTSANVGGTSVRSQLFFCLSPIVGTGHTFSVTGPAASYPAIAVQAWAGYNAFDAQNAGTGTNTVQPGSVTPSVSGTLVISGCAFNISRADASISADFHAVVECLGTNNSWHGAMAYKVKTDLSAENPIWSALPFGSGAGAASTIAIFKVGGQPTDDFNRANNSDLGACWAVGNSQSAWQISSNTAIPSNSGGDCGEYWTCDSLNADQYSEATISALAGTSNNKGIGVSVRCSASAKTFYALLTHAGASSNVYISKFSAGNWSVLASGSAQFIAGDVIRLEVQGTTLRGYRNGVQILTATDSTISTGRPGIEAYMDGGITAAALDNWKGGNL